MEIRILTMQDKPSEKVYDIKTFNLTYSKQIKEFPIFKDFSNEFKSNSKYLYIRLPLICKQQPAYSEISAYFN